MRALLTVGGYQRAAMVGQGVIESAPCGTERFPGGHASTDIGVPLPSRTEERRTELPITRLGSSADPASESHHQARATPEGQSKAFQCGFR
jgi:hypothetical protein